MAAPNSLFLRRDRERMKEKKKRANRRKKK
jgi:hypothetical protein